VNARGPRNLSGIGMTSQRTRARMVDRLREQGIRNERVLAAMGAVPRHLFVEEALASRAYEDTALPIGFSQTISQPFIVARMIEILLEGPRADRGLGKVLEVGTGCGYQAAVLAQIAGEVFSIERLAGMLERARANLLGLKLSNLRLAHGDGGLAQGGRMVLPLRKPRAARDAQRLVLIERGTRGYVETELDAVRFVPLEAGKA
jgi:protein-L-isoaspartate(D-aspartate) O-methyltransferase